MKTFIRKNKKHLLYTLLALVLFSCGNKLTEGRIVNKFYEPPRHYTVSEYDVALKMPVVRSRYDDEDYVFIVGNIIDSDTIIERFEVAHKTYDSFSIGDWIGFEH